MSNCFCYKCPLYGKTSCNFTKIDGVWKCTRELDGKTLILSTNTTGTGKMVHDGQRLVCHNCSDCKHLEKYSDSYMCELAKGICTIINTDPFVCDGWEASE